jgi:hypothetical protein
MGSRRSGGATGRGRKATGLEDFGLEVFNPLNAELNPICSLLALFGAHHILHVSR